MADITNLFKNRKVNFDKLVSFGFVKEIDDYIYRQTLLSGQFDLFITVSPNTIISSKLNDTETNEEYVLHLMPDVNGKFVNQVRKEYDNVLAEINEFCFENNVFKGEITQKVIQYISDKYRDELEFLWPKFSQNAVVRRKDNRKWYAAFLIVKKEKLGLSGLEEIEIIDLRGNPKDIPILIDGKKYFPGYHMNKKNWFTICLDGSVPLKEIISYVDESFKLALK